MGLVLPQDLPLVLDGLGLRGWHSFGLALLDLLLGTGIYGIGHSSPLLRSLGLCRRGFSILSRNAAEWVNSPTQIWIGWIHWVWLCRSRV